MLCNGFATCPICATFTMCTCMRRVSVEYPFSRMIQYSRWSQVIPRSAKSPYVEPGFVFVYLQLEGVYDRTHKCDWYFYHAELLRQADVTSGSKKRTRTKWESGFHFPFQSHMDRMDGYPASLGSGVSRPACQNEVEK